MTEPDPDLAKAEAFLAALDLKAERFTFQTFTDAAKKPRPDLLANIITARKPVNGIIDLYHRGAGVYVTVNQLDHTGVRRLEHVRRISAVWCEADDGMPSNSPLPPTLLIAPSPGHYHAYWLADHLKPWPADEAGRRDFTAVMATMVANYRSDPAAKDITRVLRLPGFA